LPRDLRVGVNARSNRMATSRIVPPPGSRVPAEKT
jgi:hypothetical protein